MLPPRRSTPTASTSSSEPADRTVSAKRLSDRPPARCWRTSAALSSKVGRAPRPSLPSGYRVGPAVGGAAVGQVPVHRRPGHPEGVGDLLHGVLAVVVHRPGLRDLVGCHLELRAAVAAPGPGRGEPVAGAFDDQVVLELGDRGEHVEEQPATRGGGVNALGQRPQPDVTGLQVVDDLLEVAHRASEPLGHHQGVAGPQVTQRLVQRRALGQRPGRVIGEGLLTASRRQCVGLRLGMLVAGRDPCVPDESPSRTVARTCLALHRPRTRVARRSCCF